MKWLWGATLGCLLCWHAAGAPAATLTGRVIAVLDGDTLTLQIASNREIILRVTEIDAPAGRQPYGARSRESLGELCHGRTARVIASVKGHDRNNPKARAERPRGRVYCNGVDVSAEQVRRGMAWVLEHDVTDRTLYALEQASRKEKRGLWRDPAPVPPWEWRVRRAAPAVPAAGGERG